MYVNENKHRFNIPVPTYTIQAKKLIILNVVYILQQFPDLARYDREVLLKPVYPVLVKSKTKLSFSNGTLALW